MSIYLTEAEELRTLHQAHEAERHHRPRHPAPRVPTAPGSPPGCAAWPTAWSSEPSAPQERIATPCRQ